MSRYFTCLGSRLILSGRRMSYRNILLRGLLGMGSNFNWFMFRMLFSQTGFKKTLKKLTIDEIIQFKDKAILEENYELASYLNYYLEFKRFKVKV